MKNELIKTMFGTLEWPKIDFDLTGVLHNAEETAGQLSISGVQPKLSVKLDKKKNELISVAKGGEYILKAADDNLRQHSRERTMLYGYGGGF